MPDQPPLNQDGVRAAEELMIRTDRITKINYLDAERIISAYLAAVLPEVTEREQLTALPDKIVLEDRRGTIWQKINGTWYTPGSKHDYSDQSVMLPARVRPSPEVKP